MTGESVDVEAQLRRAHAMGCSDPSDPSRRTLYSIAADALAAATARAEAAEAGEAALRAVHARYFDLDGKPGRDDTTPEPEDVWRYDRDFRAALLATGGAEWVCPTTCQHAEAVGMPGAASPPCPGRLCYGYAPDATGGAE